jgi:hypothetical protein
MNLDIESTPEPVDHLQPWIWAAYGSASSIASKYRNIVFSDGALQRVSQIAGWLAGLVHGGKKDVAEAAAADITAHFERLNTWGGNVEGFSFPDGSPVERLPRFMVSLSDDRTFGGFGVCWWICTPEDRLDNHPEATWLKDTWGGTFEAVRWNGSDAPERQRALYRYRFAMNGGLIYHGPGAGETFTVSLGDTRFWGIHT